MNVDHSQWIERFAMLVAETGACAWGISDAVDLPEPIMTKLTSWVDRGNHASMDYLRRHLPLKSSPDHVLEGCRSVVSLAFPYYSTAVRPRDALIFSRHALGEDYHRVIKERLRPLCAFIKDDFGGATRTCVDSAPVAERYWAVRCGLGSIGRNGLLYVPGYGSWVFLAEILTTARLPERHGGANDWRLAECRECTKCVDACPGNAIIDGTIDCRRCRAYLTIECRDEELPRGVNLGRRVYGCDICQEACPLNAVCPSDSEIFRPRPELLSLTTDDIDRLDAESFKNLTRGSSLSRITLEQLKRNAGRKDGVQPFDPQDC